MNHTRARDLIGNFNKQILVIGDVMLDRFIWGDVNRFSPEAPSCKVLDFDHEELMLGGAANVAANLTALGASVRLVGLVGYDPNGCDLLRLLFESKIVNNLNKTERKTTTKTRFVSQEDAVHLLRTDYEQTTPISDREQENMLHAVERCLGDVSGIVIADYDKGVVTRGLIREVMTLAAGRNTPVFVDPKKEHWEHYRGAELVKPNKIEAFAALGMKPGEPDVGDRLLKYTRAKAVAVTLGSDGIALYTQRGRSLSYPHYSVTAVDVSGAGDTTMAALTLARLAGADWKEAMELANTAAGIVVGKRGTSTVPADELLRKYGEVENA